MAWRYRRPRAAPTSSRGRHKSDRPGCTGSRPARSGRRSRRRRPARHDPAPTRPDRRADHDQPAHPDPAGASHGDRVRPLADLPPHRRHPGRAALRARPGGGRRQGCEPHGNDCEPLPPPTLPGALPTGQTPSPPSGSPADLGFPRTPGRSVFDTHYKPGGSESGNAARPAVAGCCLAVRSTTSVPGALFSAEAGPSRPRPGPIAPAGGDHLAVAGLESPSVLARRVGEDLELACPERLPHVEGNRWSTGRLGPIRPWRPCCAAPAVIPRPGVVRPREPTSSRRRGRTTPDPSPAAPGPRRRTQVSPGSRPAARPSGRHAEHSRRASLFSRAPGAGVIRPRRTGMSGATITAGGPIVDVPVGHRFEGRHGAPVPHRHHHRVRRRRARAARASAFCWPRPESVVSHDISVPPVRCASGRFSLFENSAYERIIKLR